MINDKVATVEPDRNALLKTDLQSSIAKLEEVWEGVAFQCRLSKEGFFLLSQVVSLLLQVLQYVLGQNLQ